MTTYTTNFNCNPFAFETTKALLSSDAPWYEKVSKVAFTVIFDATVRNPIDVASNYLSYFITSYSFFDIRNNSLNMAWGLPKHAFCAFIMHQAVRIID